MEIPTDVVPAAVTQHRKPILIGTGVVILLIIIVLGLWWFIPKELSNEAMAI